MKNVVNCPKARFLIALPSSEFKTGHLQAKNDQILMLLRKEPTQKKTRFCSNGDSDSDDDDDDDDVVKRESIFYKAAFSFLSLGLD